MQPEKLLAFNLVDLVILVLATYRLSIMLANSWELGPGRVLERLRKFFGVAYMEDGSPITMPGSFAEGLICTYCNSIWIGLIFTVIYMFLDLVGSPYGFPAVVLFLPLALSGGSVLASQLAERRA